jgi:hypothetical protein
MVYTRAGLYSCTASSPEIEGPNSTIKSHLASISCQAFNTYMQFTGFHFIFIVGEGLQSMCNFYPGFHLFLSAGGNLSTHGLAGLPYTILQDAQLSIPLRMHRFHASSVGPIQPLLPLNNHGFHSRGEAFFNKTCSHSILSQGRVFPSINAKFHSIRSIRSFISYKSFITSVGGKTSIYLHAGFHSFFLWAEFLSLYFYTVT